MPIPPDNRAPGDPGHITDHHDIADELTALVAADVTEAARALAAEALLAPKASPALTGTPTAPTATALTGTTQVATTAYADSAVTVEANRATTAEALKAPLASPALTGSPTAPTQTAGDSSTKLATTAFVTAAAALKAGLLTPTAVKTSAYTAAAGDFVPCDTTSAGFTVTLPNAPADLAVVAVKHVIQGGTNTVTIACAGSDVFNKTGGVTTGTLPLLAQGMLLQYKASSGIWYVIADDLPLSQLDGRYGRVFSPLAYGAKGDGTTDDTTPVQAAFTAAQTAKGVVDLGSLTYLTSSAIAAYSGMRVKGVNSQGAGGTAGGSIINNTSDVFTFSGTVYDVKISDCYLKATAGHVFNAGTATISFLRLENLIISLTATGKSIWNQTGGSFIDCLVGDNCSFLVTSSATVSPWSMTGMAGTVNSVVFRRMRCTMSGAGASVPFFKIDPGSTAGWNQEITYEQITFEVCSGGGIYMTGCVDVVIDTCSNWDITTARVDAASGTTSGSAVVTDTHAVSGDVGATVTGTGIPAGTTILSVVAGTSFTMSAAATATGSVSVTVGGLLANFYSFKTSAATYPCRGIQVRGGKAGATSTTNSGFNDFFADSSAVNIFINSFGSWGTPPVISSPSNQTTIINGIVASGSPTNVIPGLVASQDPLNIGVPINFFPSTLPIAASVIVANDGWYSRLISGGYAMSNIVIAVAVSSGNVCVAAYTNSGSGMSAAPTAGRLATSGSVACPAAGIATVSLGGSATPALGDWFGLSADNTTATFYRQDSGVNPGYANLPGWGTFQATAFPLPSTPSGLGVGSSGGNFIMRGS